LPFLPFFDFVLGVSSVLIRNSSGFAERAVADARQKRQRCGKIAARMATRMARMAMNLTRNSVTIERAGAVGRARRLMGKRQTV
jgi:hypothetical protein